MNELKKYNICIAGLGTVGSSVVYSLIKNHQLIIKKTNINFNILGISAKNKSKKRIFDINQFQWCEDPLKLVDISNCDIFFLTILEINIVYVFSPFIVVIRYSFFIIGVFFFI